MMEQIGVGHYVMWVNIYLPAKQLRQDNWNNALTTVAAGLSQLDVHSRLGDAGRREPEVVGRRHDPLQR